MVIAKPNAPDAAPAFYREVGAKIAAVRRRHGMTQHALAAALSLSRPSLVNIEKGRQQLLLHHFVLIARELQVKLDELLPPLQTDTAAILENLLAGVPEAQREWVRQMVTPRKRNKQ